VSHLLPSAALPLLDGKLAVVLAGMCYRGAIMRQWYYWSCKFYGRWYLGLVLALISVLLHTPEPVEGRQWWLCEPPGAQVGVSQSLSPTPVLDWTKVAKAALPAVVSISSGTMGRVPPDGPQSPFFSEPFARSGFRKSQDKTRRGRNLGSGVLVSPHGYVLTTYHVIDGAQDIRATLADRRKLRAQIVGTDPMTDLAILKLPGSGYPALPLGDSARVEVAEPVLAIGNPFGLNQTVTTGIVSALGRANVGVADYEDFIQTDAAINPGNSGGALLNACGELIGINSALFSTSGNYMGIGFAVPINMARTVLEQIVTHGRVSRGWLGIVVQELTPALARGLGKPEMRGLLVSDVAPGSPAAQMGVQRDDIVTRYRDILVDDVGQFRNLVIQSTPGSRVWLTIYRNGREQEFEASIGERRETAGQEEPVGKEIDQLGMELTDLDLMLTKRLGLPQSAQGAVVIEVLPGSPAEMAGLQSGDVIQEVNRQPVNSTKDFERAVEQTSGQAMILFVNRAGATVYLVVEPKG
jgi:Do/DeqQ family serine protease